MTLPYLLNSAWMIGCSREAAAFGRATKNVAATQANILTAMLRRDRATIFGHKHNFATIADPQTYQQRVPPSRYEDYAASLDAIAAGKSNVLTSDRVELLEPTSGSTGSEKLIPFTATLRSQFQRAVAAWMYDLLRHRPALRNGRAYWSISPAVREVRQTTSGIPIGFDDDAAYLSTAAQWMLKYILAVPSSVAQLSDMQSFRAATLWHLLHTEDITLISVWSPTFLTTLLAPLEHGLEPLLDNLAHQPAQVRSRRYAARTAALRTIFQSSLSLPEKLQRIWPRLGLISCWADGASAHYLGALQIFFPAVEIQPKGLLATEGCVSFPLLGRPAPVLAVRSHFFEFQEIDTGTLPRLAHQLERGGYYRVILTTGGGLYRYELRDEVEIVSFENQCPLLRFVGKSDGVSDLVGEKLSEPQIRTVLTDLLNKHGLTPTFVLLVPVAAPLPSYRLYLQERALPTDAPVLAALEIALETGLCQNPHYAYARQLGQLAPVQIVQLESSYRSCWDPYEQQGLARGMRMGNIKPVMLDRWSGWPAVLDPYRLIR